MPRSDGTAPLAEAIEADALIIGAGPIGLFQVFELGLLDIKAHVVDTLPYAGGQCIELYADKPIYDIPAVKRCTGRELVERLLDQAAPFDPVFHLGQEVSVVAKRGDGRFDVTTSKGTRFVAKAIIVAGGVGSFQRRELKVHGLAEFEGRQVFYRLPDTGATRGQHVVIAGSTDPAVDAAIELARCALEDRPASITLIHRRDVFQAPDERLALLAQLRAEGRIGFIAGQIDGGESHDDRLQELKVSLSGGGENVVAADVLLVLLGVSPKLGPIADWGLAIDRKQVVVDTEKFETDVPGIFAVGDINSYPGKRKLIVSGFHEATLAAFAVSPYVYPDKRVLLQYTTTSPKLHQALGVTTGASHAPKRGHQDESPA